MATGKKVVIGLLFMLGAFIHAYCMSLDDSGSGDRTQALIHIRGPSFSRHHIAPAPESLPPISAAAAALRPAVFSLVIPALIVTISYVVNHLFRIF